LHNTSNLKGTGTVTFYLYAPGTTCHNDGSGSPVYSKQVTGISTNGPFLSGSYGPPLVAGTYQWVAVFSGDANNISTHTACGDEPVVITASPTITTDQTPTSGSVGDTLNDSATLHNTSNLKGTGTVTIYLFEPGVDCNTAGTGSVQSWSFPNVSGNGPFLTSATSGFKADQAGTYQFLAVFSGDANNNGANSGCGSEPVVINPAEIHIKKTADKSQVNAGDPIGFTLTVWNDGNGNAYDVNLSDPLPTNPGLHWVIADQGSGWAGTCKITAGELDCGPVTVPANTSQANSSFTVHITSVTDTSTGGDCSETGLVDNKGTVTTGNDGTDNSSAEICVAAPLIHIKKTADKSQVNAGDPIGFTMSVWNSGNGDAYNVNLSDPLPTNPGLAWTIESQGSGWGGTCKINNNNELDCGPVTVPAGTQQGDPAFEVHITSDTTAATGGDCVETSGVVDNTGSVTTSNDGQGSSEATICVAAPLIHIKKTADAAQVNAGEDIGFTMTVWNSGIGDAKGVTLTDPLPTNPGLSWSVDAAGAGFGSGADCSISQQNVLTCGPETVPAGTDQESSTFWVHITSHTSKLTAGDCEESGLVDNTGSVTTSNDGQGSSEAAVCVLPADVSITKTADHSAPVHAGDPIGFTVEVKNAGTGAATGVNLSDPLPAGSGSGVTWAIDTSVGTPSQFVLSGAKGSQTLSLESSTLPAGADYKVHVTAQTSETECGTYDNTATLTTGNANNPDPASAAESCVYRVDLQVTKSGTPPTQELGQGNITWTMVVTNNGPDNDTGVKISDPMPPGNTYVSSTTTQGTCTGGAILTCDIGPMAAGASVTITLITTPSMVGTQTNTVVVSGDRPETNLTNNTATASVEVGPFTPPCIKVSKITPGYLLVGRKTTVTIHLTQAGKAAKGVKVRIKGAGINVVTARSDAKGITKHVLKMKRKGVLTFFPIASATGVGCSGKEIGVRGVFTPPVTG
jgi:uncharacterized repeat protein (TIGR01451 family)